MTAVKDIRRQYYQNPAAFDQAFLDTTFIAGETDINFICEITLPNSTTLRLSDRPLYVGNNFYMGRVKIPSIERNISELLSPSITFSEMEIEISNVDGYFNKYLVGGASYTTFFGQSVVIKAGVGSNPANYRTMFVGRVPFEESSKRGSKNITIRARDDFETLNAKPVLPSITTTDFPSAPSDSVGKVIPFVLGDWNAGLNTAAGTSVEVEGNLILNRVPANFYGGTIGYNVGGGFFVFSIGTYTPNSILQCYVKRGDNLLECNYQGTPSVGAGYWLVQVTSLKIDPSGNAAYNYLQGDVAVIGVVVPYAGAAYSNPVRIAKEIFGVLGGVQQSEFDVGTWGAVETKSNSILARVWIGDREETILNRALGVLKQIRVDAFFDSNRRIKLRTLHLDDFPQATVMARIPQVSILESTINPETDRRNYFNAAAGNYAFTPVTGKTSLQTVKRRNQKSINGVGQEVGKEIDFPMLYTEAHVLTQVDEYVRFYSAGLEYIRTSVAWTHLLRDLGEFLAINFDVGSIMFNNAPTMVRSIAINPQNASVDVVLLSFANLPYQNYQPDFQDNMLSSYDQPIT